MLKALTQRPLLLFLFFWAFSGAIVGRQMRIFNKYAAEKKTSSEIALLSVSTILGPMAGLITSDSELHAASWVFAGIATLALLSGLLVSLTFFFRAKNRVPHRPSIAWVGFSAMCLIWCFSAIKSIDSFH